MAETAVAPVAAPAAVVETKPETQVAAVEAQPVVAEPTTPPATTAAVAQPVAAKAQQPEIDPEVIRGQLRKEIETELRATLFEEARKDEIGRYEAVLKAVNGDSALAGQYFRNGHDGGKAKELYSQHVTELASKRIPTGLNSPVSQAQAAAKASYFARWDKVSK